jgi:hypothetical protein
VGAKKEYITFPLAMLNNIQDGVTPFQWGEIEFDDLQKVDWTKSYFQFNAAAAGTPYVIPLGITYLKLNSNNQKV